MNESVELSYTLGAFLGVVREIGEAALFGTFVGLYHNELI